MKLNNLDAGGSQPDWPSHALSMILDDAADPALPARFALPLRHGMAGRPGSSGAVRLQPIHAPDGGALLGAEATCPGQAAGDGLGGISHLLRAACETAASLAAHPVNRRRLIISLRLPPGSGCDRLLVDRTEAALEEADLRPTLLEIGLDGDAMQNAGADALLAMSALRDLGIGLSLYRTGRIPVALSRLRRLPLTTLRLDPSIVPCLGTSHDARRAVAEAVQAAHALDAAVVATGVETAWQRDIAAELGCDAAQGKLFGLPMPARDFHEAVMT